MLNYTNYQEQLIGTGLELPNTFDEITGKTLSNSGLERINQSINHILSTRIGERFFLPEFGSRLYELVFEPNDYILEDLLKLYVSEALSKWEKRIKLLEVTPVIEKGGNTVPINIYYNLINTNMTANYVYPFNRDLYTLGSYGGED
jgi:phage baseplate assembly protein W